MSVESFAQRCRWYVRALGTNPLVRTSDRFEALAVLAVLVATVLAIPLAAHFGEDSYDGTLATVTEQNQTRHPVDAVVTVPSATLPTDFYNPPSVVAQWHEGTHLRTERIVTAATLNAGAPLTVWLDSNGKTVSAPLTPADARVNGLSVAWTVWIMAVVFSCLAALGVRKWLDHSRARAWERQLSIMANNDDGWANRRA